MRILQFDGFCLEIGEEKLSMIDEWIYYKVTDHKVPEDNERVAIMLNVFKKCGAVQH